MQHITVPYKYIAPQKWLIIIKTWTATVYYKKLQTNKNRLLYSNITGGWCGCYVSLVLLTFDWATAERSLGVSSTQLI